MTNTNQSNEIQKVIKNYCVAITGAIATGKSEVANILRKLGYIVIDADQLSRDVVHPGSKIYEKIIEVFGESIKKPDGTIDRHMLLAIIMHDPVAKKTLESIMHPAIQLKFESEVKKQNLGQGTLFFYEAALIFELGRENQFKECWATYCSEDTQIKRLSNRSQLTREQCLSIINSQLPATVKASMATKSIDTECDRDSLSEKIKKILKTTL